MIGCKLHKFSGFNGVTLERLSSQMIGSKGLKLCEFDGVFLGQLYGSLMKIGVNSVWWLLFLQNFSGSGHNSMPEQTTPLTTNHNYVNTGQQTVPKPLLALFFLLLFFFTPI